MKYLGLPLSITALKRADLQRLEDKITKKIASGNWKNVNMAGRRVLVRAVLTSRAICHTTSVDLPKEVLARIIALLRAYLWSGCDKVTGGNARLIGIRFDAPSMEVLVFCTLRSLPQLFA
jgi:hypothetical protein